MIKFDKKHLRKMYRKGPLSARIVAINLWNRMEHPHGQGKMAASMEAQRP